MKMNSSVKPMFLLRTEFFDIIKSVGAESRTLTLKQVLDYLKNYITVRKLFNPLDPKEIRVAADPLGGVFGTDTFTIPEVMKLLHGQMFRIFSPEVTGPEVSTEKQGLETPMDAIKRTAEDIETPDAGTSNESKRPKYSGGTEVSVRRSPIYLSIPPSPVILSGDETELSLQGYETDYVKNSSDDLWFLDEDNDNDTDTFEIEYEVESVASDTAIAISDTDSEIEDAVCAALFLCQDDSDVQFWGDKSEDEGHETSDDPELEEGDKWTCKQCSSVNKPTTRYCLKCFDQRVGWLQGSDRHRPKRHRKLHRNLSDPGYQSSQSTVTASQDSEESSLSQESRNLVEKCPLCLERPKTGTIIHGKTAHQAYCYKCARKLHSTGQRCPICRRTIQRVVRNFIV